MSRVLFFFSAACLILVSACSPTDGAKGEMVNPAWLTTHYRVEGKPPFVFTVTSQATNPTGSLDLLYFLHGAGGDAYTLIHDHSDLLNAFALDKLGVTIVSISFGKSWFLVPQNGSPTSGLYRTFVDTAVPHIEDQLGVPVGHRFVMGISMGGFNALQILTRNPGFFSGAALLSPAVMAQSPYDPPPKIQAYIERTRDASFGIGDYLLYWSGQRDRAQERIETIFVSQGKALPDATSWQEASPLSRLESTSFAADFALYLSCGRSDGYGLFESAEKIKGVLQKRGIDTTWKPLSGGHVVYHAPTVSAFFRRQIQ